MHQLGQHNLRRASKNHRRHRLRLGGRDAEALADVREGSGADEAHARLRRLEGGEEEVAPSVRGPQRERRCRPDGGVDRLALVGRRRGVGQVGPQRDSVEILLNDRPLASYGSSGQVRTALWLLKLTRVQLLSDREAQPPLFLLDDVEAELDEARVGQMMRLTHGRAQLVMTATRPLDPVWGPLSRFRVEAGQVKEER